ncbi:MAG: hypothetical protein ACTSUE_26305 [Promethearchaeota archaeon]
MSFWGKIFSKKDEPHIKQLETELDSVLKKSNSEFIVLVGLSGKIKGIDIITVKNQKQRSFGEKQIKKFAAKGAEFYTRFKSLDFMPDEFGESARVIKFYYNTNMQFYLIPITDSFMLFSYNSVAIRILNNLDKIRDILNNIKSESGGN